MLKVIAKGLSITSHPQGWGFYLSTFEKTSREVGLFLFKFKVDAFAVEGDFLEEGVHDHVDFVWGGLAEPGGQVCGLAAEVGHEEVEYAFAADGVGLGGGGDLFGGFYFGIELLGAGLE